MVLQNCVQLCARPSTQIQTMNLKLLCLNPSSGCPPLKMPAMHAAVSASALRNFLPAPVLSLALFPATWLSGAAVLMSRLAPRIRSQWSSLRPAARPAGLAAVLSPSVGSILPSLPSFTSRSRTTTWTPSRGGAAARASSSFGLRLPSSSAMRSWTTTSSVTVTLPGWSASPWALSTGLARSSRSSPTEDDEE